MALPSEACLLLLNRKSLRVTPIGRRPAPTKPLSRLRFSNSPVWPRKCFIGVATIEEETDSMQRWLLSVLIFACVIAPAASADSIYTWNFSTAPNASLGANTYTYSNERNLHYLRRVAQIFITRCREGMKPVWDWPVVIATTRLSRVSPSSSTSAVCSRRTSPECPDAGKHSTR